MGHRFRYWTAWDERLVDAELRRGHAPDTVDMQALGHAAMASRFDPERLAEAYTAFLESRDEDVTDAEAIERLSSHTQFSVVDTETLRSPRVVLRHGSCCSLCHSSTDVWLSEMGVAISPVQFQAYRSGDRVLVSVSTLCPVKDAEDFTVAPTQAIRRSSTHMNHPDVEWSALNCAKLAGVVTKPNVAAALTSCAASPGEWIGLRDIEDRTAQKPGQDRSCRCIVV